MKYLRNMFRRHRSMYVIIDGSDNSVTLSQHLCKHMDCMGLEAAKVFVFRLAGADITYGFCLNPNLGQETQLADIQYNSKYHCVGFESLNPTVNRMLYDYGLPAMSRVKLSVEVCRAGDMEYYKISRPCKT